MKKNISKYTLSVEEGDKLLLFNGISTGLLELNSEYKDKYLKMMNGEETYKDLEENLYKGNFINVVDEIELVKYLDKMSRFDDATLGLTIAPTLECNFKCSYCFEEGHRHNTMDENVQNAIVNFVNAAKDRIQNLAVVWYGGEPLLQMGIIENLTAKFMEICEKNNINYDASIITNGYLLSREYAERLNKVHVYSGQITLDGPRHIHDTRRMLLNDKGTYDRIMKNILETYDLIDTSIRINADNTNIEYANIVLNDLKENGLDGKVHVYVAQVDDINNPNISNICTPIQIFSEKQTAFYEKAMEMGFDVVNLPGPRFGVCGALSKSGFVIDPLGDLYKCWNTIGLKEEMIGSLMDDSIRGVNENLLKWMNYEPVSGKCSECEVLPLCMGGCPYQKVVKDENKCIDIKYTLNDVVKLYNQRIKKLKTQDLVESTN